MRTSDVACLDVLDAVTKKWMFPLHFEQSVTIPGPFICFAGIKHTVINTVAKRSKALAT
jgi:hypothetical protein